MSEPTGRVQVAGVLGTTAVAGLLFVPVFGLRPLVVPVFAVLLACYVGVELGLRWPRLAAYRPMFVLTFGAVALYAALMPGLPGLASIRRGVTEGWRLTLESTWPARPDAEQLLFVPLVVLLAALLGVELLLRLRRPAAALLPGLAVVGLAQAYQSLTGGPAMLAAACYAVPAALVLRGRRRPDLWVVLPTLVAVGAGAVLIGAADPADRQPYRLRDGFVAPVHQSRLSNPLHEIAGRLADPDREVFRYRTDGPVDRWSLVVLDAFDGASWSSNVRMRRLGAQAKAAPGTVTRSADVHAWGLDGPWLPSQPVPLGVEGLAPLVDQTAGTLLLDQPGPERRYRLAWSEPTGLGGGAVDTRVPGGLGDLGVVPPELHRFASDATRGLDPSVASALQLERFLREHYRSVAKGNLPTGHGWQQLRHFLLESKVGTSEQFAAAYVVLARMSGIPARLVVGYRGSTRAADGTRVVRNRDVLAWPEIAVAGVGWVPLDPTPPPVDVPGGPAEKSGLAEATEEARDQLRPERGTRSALPSTVNSPIVEARTSRGWIVAAAVVPGLLVCLLLGVPLAKALRTRLRRRRTGAAGVLAAWADVCERLSGYRPGMTPRDLAGLVADDSIAQPILRLGHLMDLVLWSGLATPPEESARYAWAEARVVRRSLARRPLGARLRAALDPRPLRSWR